ncbi:hypothetical protein B0H10DRAFT_1887661, partial [Mycena sp. CBHHK59/15]
MKTRWNSTYDMIIAALQYRCAYRKFTTDKSNGLQKFVLTAAEWTVLEDLCYILGVHHLIFLSHPTHLAARASLARVALPEK